MTPKERKELELLEQMDEPQGNWLAGATETLANSMALGLGDEIGAGINALTGMANEDEGFTDAYERLLSESQTRTGEFAQENPWTSIGLKVAPAMLGGIASAPKLLGSAPGLLRTTAVGVGEAGFYGAAEAEQDNRLEGAVKAAPFGLIAPVAQVAGSAVRGLVGSKANTASQIIDDAIDSSGMNRAQVGNALQGDAMLADTSPQLKAFGMGVANMTPGTRQAASALDQRASGMTERVISAIKKASPGAKRLSQTRREVMSRQSELAKPLYKKAYSSEIPVSPELQSILKTPAGQSAFKSAQRIAGNDKRVLPEIYTVSDSGKITVSSMPDMQAWDDIKRGFDDVIERETSDFGKLSAEGRRTLLLKNEMLGILDDINPSYKEARSMWAGEQAVINAMEDGRRALNKSVDEVIDMTENVSVSERDAMLKGLVSDITERMGRRGDNTVGGFSFLNNLNARTKLVAILGDDPNAVKIADNIIDTVSKERGFAQTRVDVLGGSQTNIRKQAEEMLSGSRGGINDITSVSGVLREGMKQLRKIKGISTTDADELAKHLFDPAMTEQKLNSILKNYDVSNAVKTKLRALSLGASTGATQVNE